MRYHVLFAALALASLLASAYLAGEWQTLAGSESLLAGSGAIEVLLGLPPSHARPLLPVFSEGALQPFGPSTPVEALVVPLLFLGVCGAVFVVAGPSGPLAPQRGLRRESRVNPRDGSLMLRTGAGFSAYLAAFERSWDGALSFSVLASNAGEEPLAFLRVYRDKSLLGQFPALAPGEVKSLEVRWGAPGAPEGLTFHYATASDPQAVHRLRVTPPWDDLLPLFERENSLAVLSVPVSAPAVPAVPRAGVAPAAVPAPPASGSLVQVRERQQAVLEKLRRRAEEERKAAEALVTRVPYAPLLPELAPGVSLLVEGPVSSKKGEMVAALARRALERGGSLAWCSFDPARDIEGLAPERREGIIPVPANIVLEETGIAISKLTPQRPALSVFDVLYRYTPKYPPETLLKFLAFNIGKLREAGAASVWLIESTMDPRALASIEGEFDAVLEFVVREEHGELRSYYRTKKFKGRPFSSELLRWG